MADVKPYLIFGPARYIDPNFDVKSMMTLNFYGQEIDIGTGCKIFDVNQKRWRLANENLNTRNRMRIFNRYVPIVTRRELLALKQAIGRPQDRRDARALATVV